MIKYIAFGLIVLAVAYVIRICITYREFRKYGRLIDLEKAKTFIDLFSNKKKMLNRVDIFSEHRKIIAMIERTGNEFIIEIPNSIEENEMEILKIAEHELNKPVYLGGVFKLEYSEFKRMTEIIFHELERRQETVRLRWDHNTVSGKF